MKLKIILTIVVSLFLSLHTFAEESAAAATSSAASASNVDRQDNFDGLGGNRILLEKAQALNPELQTSVVQSREVSRHYRFELAPEYSSTFGGDNYIKTHGYGLNAYFHFNPRWAVGVRYQSSYNKLTAEGQARLDRAEEDYKNNPKDPSKTIPDVSYPKSQTMGVIHWYPMYGKINWLDKKVVQFDAYALVGAGNVELNTGSTSSWMTGGGIGFWFTPRLSTRIEAIYQTYTAKYFDGEVKAEIGAGSFQVGWLL